MGRDDNRALPGLSGGHAPARAFHDYMVRAVANRPVEQFQTDAAGPEWDVEGGDNALLEIAPPNDQPFVDADGNPVERDSPPRPDDDRALRPDDGLPPDDEGLRPDDGDDNRDVRRNMDAGALIGA
jgi:penicillin-binding protein 1A